MRINFINNFIKPHTNSIKYGINPANNTYQNTKSSNVSSSLKQDSVSFTAANAQALEKIYKYGLRDIYSNIIMINPNDYYKLKNNGIFSGPSKIAVETLEKYRKNLFGNERKILTVIKNESKKHPDETLLQLVKNLYSPHREKLRKAQEPVLHSIMINYRKMPKEYRLKLRELMALTRKKLDDKPHIYKFSAKEFAYKLEKMSTPISNPQDRKKMIQYSELLMSEKLKNAPDHLPISFLEEIFSSKKGSRYTVAKSDKLKNQIHQLNTKKLSRKKTLRLKNKILRNIQNMFGKDTDITIENLNYMHPKVISKQDVQLRILDRIKRIIEKNNAPVLKNLCDTAECMIKQKPVLIPFSRKSFIYDLSKALEGLPDEALRREMIKTAYTLPTSSNNVSAFILKHYDRTSDKIAYGLLNPSFCSIEHIKPESLKGASDMSNYTVASRRFNSERGNLDMSEYLKKFPKSYPQKAFNRYIELANEGLFNPDYVIAMKTAIDTHGGTKLSVKKLRYKEAKLAYKLNNTNFQTA